VGRAFPQVFDGGHTRFLESFSEAIGGSPNSFLKRKRVIYKAGLNTVVSSGRMPRTP
jgi:hypothetical protein